MSKSEKSVHTIISFLKIIFIIGIVIGFLGLIGCAFAPTLLTSIDPNEVVDPSTGQTIGDLLSEYGMDINAVVNVMRAATIPCAALTINSIICVICFSNLKKHDTPFNFESAKHMFICGFIILILSLVSSGASAAISPELASFDTGSLILGATLMFVSRLLQLGTEKINGVDNIVE